MKNLKVVFFGTPDFAAKSLEAIHHSHHEIVGVVTVADKPSGRRQKISLLDNGGGLCTIGGKGN